MDVRHLQRAGADWNESEQEQLRRLRITYPSPDFEIQCGCSDEGDPWCAVCEMANYEGWVLHIARIDRRYLAIRSGDLSYAKHAGSLSEAIDWALSLHSVR